MKKQESVIYNNDKQEYIIKKETPNAAFLTSIPRILEIVIAPKEHEEELIEDNDLENDIIPISSLRTEIPTEMVLLIRKIEMIRRSAMITIDA